MNHPDYDLIIQDSAAFPYSYDNGNTPLDSRHAGEYLKSSNHVAPCLDTARSWGGPG